MTDPQAHVWLHPKTTVDHCMYCGMLCIRVEFDDCTMYYWAAKASYAEGHPPARCEYHEADPDPPPPKPEPPPNRIT